MSVSTENSSMVSAFFWSEAEMIDGVADDIEQRGMNAEMIVNHLRALAVDCRKASDAAAAGRTEILS